MKQQLLSFLSQQNTRLLARIALVAVALFWGTSMTFVHSALQAYPAPLILALRYSLAVVALVLFFGKQLRGMDREDLKAGFWIGAGLCLATNIQSAAVFWTTPGRSSVLSASYCVMVPFLFWLTYKQRPDRFNLIAAFLCIFGVYLVGSAEAGSATAATGSLLFRGDAMALLSGFFYACHIVAIAICTRGRNPIRLTILQFVVAALLCWIYSAFSVPWAQLSFHLPALLDIAYLGIFCTAVALLLQNVAQQHTDPSSASIILGTESVFGVLFPALMGVEKPGLRALLGCGLIFVAILVSETKPRRLLRRGRRVEVAETAKRENDVI